MRLLNALVVAVTLLATVGGYLQEKGRLAAVRRLPVVQARAMFERAQGRRERALIVFTAVLVAGAAAALIVRLAR